MSAQEQVRAGYKQTEAGVIPEYWGVTAIGNVFSISAGGDFDPTRSSEYRDASFPFPIYSNALTKAGLYGFCSYSNHMASSITVTARGTLGSANFRDHPFTAIGRVIVLEPKAQQDGLYFATYINERIKFAIESTGVPQLTAPQIAKYQIPIPSFPEQRAIAAALSDADALIASLDALIAKKRDLKQAAMQQLLTGQTRLPGFEGEWEMKKLGDIADIDPDSLGSETSADYAFKYISLEDVSFGTLTGYSEQIFRSAPSRARRKLRLGDILVSTVRPNLKSHLLFSVQGEHWICSTGFSVVRCRARITHPAYVFYHFFARSVSRQIETLLTGSNYPAINSRDVCALQIQIPSFDEQTAIGAVLSDMDADLATLKGKRDKARAIKQAMMQELLTGRIRLV